MKNAVIITSLIDVDNKFPLTYSPIRSFFNKEERLRQTIFTIINLQSIFKNSVTFYLLESSNNFMFYKNYFAFQSNLKFVSIKERFPDIHLTVTSHPNKSFCETLSLIRFIQDYKQELKTFDNIFKISGRYFTDDTFSSITTLDLKNNLIFKLPLKWEWKNEWGYSMVDLRNQQGDNLLYQYCSVLYGFGNNLIDNILVIYQKILTIVGTEEGKIYDVETLLYFFTRTLTDKILHFEYTIYGWLGPNGNFVKY